MTEGDKKDDATHVGGAPPVVPKLPSAAPSSNAPPAAPDATHIGSAPPPVPHPTVPKSPPISAAPPLEPAAAASDDEGEETVAIAPVTQRTPFSLQRIQPAGHTGVVYLTRDIYLIGRKQGADLLLFSPTASREHARLERRSDGWYILPIEDKRVVANGSGVQGALRLEHKMRLQIGGDELIFFDESTPTRAATSAAIPAATSRRWLVVLLIAVLVAMAVGVTWLLRM